MSFEPRIRGEFGATMQEQASYTRCPLPGLPVSAFADPKTNATENETVMMTARRIIDLLHPQRENRYFASAAMASTSKTMINREITPMPHPIPPIIFIMLSIIGFL